MFIGATRRIVAGLTPRRHHPQKDRVAAALMAENRPALLAGEGRPGTHRHGSGVECSHDRDPRRGASFRRSVSLDSTPYREKARRDALRAKDEVTRESERTLDTDKKLTAAQSLRGRLMAKKRHGAWPAATRRGERRAPPLQLMRQRRALRSASSATFEAARAALAWSFDTRTKSR